MSILTLGGGTWAGAADAPLEIPLIKQGNDQSSLFVHLPAADQRNGVAVIICPGGGYAGVSMDSEGHSVARWFKAHGVAGIVLKYRLPGKNGNPPGVIQDDAKAAIRLVRSHALEWGIDPQRVGIMGFSAGGHVAVMAGTHYDADTRPDFMALIYPVISVGKYGYPGCNLAILGSRPDPALVKFYSGELNVTKDTPPTFLAHAGDDQAVNVHNSLDFYQALLAAGVPAELHLYEVGGHGLKGGIGYGIGGNSRTISSTWNDRLLEWMQQRGIVKSARQP